MHAAAAAAAAGAQPRFETEAFELLPYETAQLFRAAELQNEVDEEEEP